MLAARPIVASYSAGNDPVSEARCGFTGPAEDVDALVAGLDRMRALSPEERAALGRRGHEFVRSEHDYTVIADRFLATIEEAKLDPNPHGQRLPATSKPSSIRPKGRQA
jgi:glycosyltransferase involved in cell wall biosynthesis